MIEQIKPNFLNRIKQHPLLICLLSVVFLMSVLCLILEPIWETNDDVAMSMIAHGYGLSSIGSPLILFSNVIWGWLVRIIPEINGVLGYSTATLGVLFIVGVVFVYGLFRFGMGYVACFSMLSLILLRPVLFPQFTINAGLLSVAAIICWHLYAKDNDWRALVMGCIFAYGGYLVRSQEFFLVMIVALPLLPWRALLLNRAANIAFLILASTVIISAFIDHDAYQNPAWRDFNALNPARLPYTDFGASQRLKQHPDILACHGYSDNDIELIHHWFFVDPSLASPKKLNMMLAESGVLSIQTDLFKNGWLAIQALWSPRLLTLVLTALLLAIFRPRWQVAASWGLFVLAVLVLGWLGRPAIIRVYVPIVCLLLLAPFLDESKAKHGKRYGVLILLISALLNAKHVIHESKAYASDANVVRNELSTFPSFPVVVWGGAFPYESIFPVLRVSSSSSMSYQLYSLGWPTLMPFTVSSIEQQSGRGMTTMLMQKKGISIMASDELFKQLAIYCKEHFHGQLRVISLTKYGEFSISKCRCVILA